MPLARTRLLNVSRYALYFDGIDDYAKMEPFIVYGWQEITIEELVYFYRPKAKVDYSHSSSMGDGWAIEPMTDFYSPNVIDYPYLYVRFWSCVPRTSYSTNAYNIINYVNRWAHVVRRFTATRELSYHVNASKLYSKTIPSDQVTILEWNPAAATRPALYKRFVLGASPFLNRQTKMMYAYFRIYSRALSDDEIAHNYNYPWNPTRNGLVVWLHAHPDYIKDIDNDGILEWIDLSGFNNHAKIYGATLVEVVQASRRALAPVRTLTPSR